ncbi:uncharacterized protein BKA78DRAFT_32819 [Phyllosticta capitalensis]|uniref:uncharacterized protein n=1 Tax=Phyllosticta capitalensis TaxID=121624 RepID=UPI00312D3553
MGVFPPLLACAFSYAPTRWAFRRLAATKGNSPSRKPALLASFTPRCRFCSLHLRSKYSRWCFHCRFRFPFGILSSLVQIGGSGGSGGRGISCQHLFGFVVVLLFICPLLLKLRLRHRHGHGLGDCGMWMNAGVGVGVVRFLVRKVAEEHLEELFLFKSLEREEAWSIYGLIEFPCQSKRRNVARRRLMEKNNSGTKLQSVYIH